MFVETRLCALFVIYFVLPYGVFAVCVCMCDLFKRVLCVFVIECVVLYGLLLVLFCVCVSCLWCDVVWLACSCLFVFVCFLCVNVTCL